MWLVPGAPVSQVLASTCETCEWVSLPDYISFTFLPKTARPKTLFLIDQCFSAFRNKCPESREPSSHPGQLPTSTSAVTSHCWGATVPQPKPRWRVPMWRDRPGTRFMASLCSQEPVTSEPLDSNWESISHILQMYPKQVPFIHEYVHQFIKNGFTRFLRI